MNGSYKIKISEGTKSVTCEVAVENEDKEKALQEAVELYDTVSQYSKTKTREKQIENG